MWLLLLLFEGVCGWVGRRASIRSSQGASRSPSLHQSPHAVCKRNRCTEPTTMMMRWPPRRKPEFSATRDYGKDRFLAGETFMRFLFVETRGGGAEELRELI